MSAVINTKQKNLGMDYLKRTAGYISGAVGSYISEAMPVTSSTLSDAKNTISEVNSKFGNTAQSILPKVREIRRQVGFKNISDWFNQKENDFDSNGFNEAEMDFDIDVDDVAAEAQITELAETGNQISRAVIESAHKSVEAQIEATANLTTSISSLTSVVTSGFDQTNKLLSKMLEVLSKNTSTLIEATVANNSQTNPEQDLIGSGRFNLSDYKKVVSSNIKNSEFGMIATMLPMLLNPDMIRGALSPQELIKSGLSFGLNKVSPNFRKNLKALDEAVSDTIMDSLIRLGENRDFGERGLIGKLFGLDSSRKQTDTSRSKLELKSVPYDTISKEALTNAIPGYLRQILIAVGGPDMIYDYRSRSFKTKAAIKKEFLDASSGGGALWNASDHVRSKIGTSRFSQMSYDLMMNDLSSKTSHGQGRRQVDKFRNPQEAEDYVLKVLYGGQLTSEQDIAEARAFASSLSKISPGKLHDITNQVARSNINRSKRMAQYAKTADQYNVDLSGLSDSASETAQVIREAYGRGDLGSKGSDESAVIKRGDPTLYATKGLSGVNYTNIALYEIYRKLNDGINVFKTGESKKPRRTPYPVYGDERLPRPKDYKPKLSGTPAAGGEESIIAPGAKRDPDDPNLLRNQTLEDGTEENLTRGERFGRWGKKRGGDLAHAIFSGDPEQVRTAFGAIVGDVSQVAGDGIKDGISRINDSFGNVSGYLKHKMFGTEYTYTEKDEKGNPVTKIVEKNEDGGLFGFVGKKFRSMFDEAKASGSKWFQTVAKYFDYGDKDDSGEIKSKRKRLIDVSVGALAGAGILGGPIGLIMGAVAGNALSATGFGDKIKGFLFGRDEKGKAKGLLTRVGDSIVDPIRYQMGKSVEHVGNILKKNILGPLSDIGAAIHDRITSAASDTFGKLFTTIGNIILAPFKGIGKSLISAAKLPITLAGNLFRGVTGIESGVAGGVMNATASLIAGKSTHKIKREDGTVEEISTREWLKQRRKERAADVKDSRKTSKYRDYKTWQAETHEQDAADRDALKRAMSEKVRDYDPEKDGTAEIKEDTAEIKEAATKQADDTAEIKQSVNEMAKEALTEGSLFTHDKGLHDRLDEIISFITGKKSSVLSETSEGESSNNGDKIKNTLDENRRENEEASIKGSLISGASTLIASGDKVDSEESRITNSMLSEVGKDDADKNKIVKEYQELMALQDSKKEEAAIKEKEEKSIFEKILDTITDSGLLGNLGLLAGAAALIASLLNGNLGDTLGNIKTGLDYLMGKHTGADEEGMDSVDDGVNAALAVVDANVSSKWSLANPFAKVFHTRRDGSGTKVVDQDKTGAKFNWQLGVPLAQSITQPAMYNILAHNQELKTYSLIEQSQAATSPRAAARLDARANKAAELSDQYAEKAEELSTHAGSGIAGSIANNFARVGIMTGISNGVGGLVNLGAQRLGFDEETSQKAGNIATAGTTSALLFNQAKSTVTGKSSMVDNILTLLKKAFNALADKFASVDKLRSIAGKVGEMFDNIYNKSIGKITETVATKIAQAIAARTGQEVTKELISTVTVGIGIAIGAVSGVISGVCSAEHLFQVKPGEADGLMTTISAVMKGVFGALEWTPVVGLVVAAIDIFDKFVFKSVFGKSLEQIIAEMLYNLMKGDGGAVLAEKQGAMVDELNYYNETYGASMNVDTFNDFANNGGLIDKFWRGGMQYGEDGHFKVDEAGGRIDGGFKGLFVGGEKAYAHDSSGAVLKDEYGNAVQAVDQYGRGMKVDAKWGDAVGNWFSDVGRWFTGGNTYKTDENGQAIRDENGALVVESTSKNVLGRAGDAISNWWNGEEITNPDGTTTKTKGFAEAASETMKGIGSTIATPFKEVGSWFKSTASGIKDWWGGTEVTNPDGSVTKTEGFADAAKRTLGNIGSTIAQPFKDIGSGIKNWWSGEAELDENGDPIKDENGNVVRKGGFKDWAGSTIGKVSSTFGNITRGVGATVKDWVLGQYERDEDGNPLLDEEGNPIRKGGLAGWVQSGLGTLNSTFVEPAKEMINGAKEWVRDKAEWVKDGIQSAKDWIGEKATSMWTTISTPVKEFVDGAKDWAHNTADFIAEGASNAASWIKDKAKNAWTAISTPVKEFTEGASQWVSDKATWLGDKAKDVGSWISTKATEAWTGITTPVKDMIKGIGEWTSEKAEWVKDKAKDVKDWIGDKAKSIFSGITDNIKGMATGIKDWVENKADWVKEGVKDVGSWIGEKAKGIWDWITGPIKDLEERGEQDKKDSEYINSRSGGPIGGVGGPHSQTELAVQDGGGGSNGATVKEGGNPLNKAFGISSKYGWRVLDKGKEFHSGIDMYPTDGSREAEVGARFNGTIKSVQNNVSASGLNAPSNQSAGNYVTYVTDSGMTIKNFHLKKGSIPSNIKPGERVKVGDKLGDMGTTGRSTGPHLHYQMESPSSTDAKGNHTFDPTSSVNGGETMSSFNSYGYTYDSSSSSVVSGTSDSSTGTTTSSGLTGLAALIEMLKNAGSAFLNKITGGLFGNANANSTSMINTTGADSGASTTSSIFYAGSKVNDVEEFLNIARKEIGTKENPSGSNNVKYNTWFYGKAVSGNDYPWCMAFVQWCFDQAGLPIQYKTAGCGSLLEWYKKNAPDRLIERNGDVKPGDIFLFNNHTHTGIVEKVSGNQITTIEGNTSSNDKGSQSNGGCVARKVRDRSKIMNFIRVVDFEALATSAQSLSGAGEGAEALWKFLKGMGYNDIAIAGILGCWENESALRAKRIEGDYLANFPGYEAMMNDQSVMDRWVREGLHKTPEKNPGYFIGNHAYPGIGFAQWTRGRTKALVDYAKSVGKSWFDPAAQLGYFQQELSNNYYKKSRPEELNKAGSVDAATRQFCSNFEGYNGDSGISKRQASARQLYNNYAGKITGLAPSDATGGTSDIIYPSADDQEVKPVGGQLLNEQEGIDFEGVDANMGKGGPTTAEEPSSEVVPANYVKSSTITKPAKTSSSVNVKTSTTPKMESSFEVPRPDATEYSASSGGVESTDLSGVITLLQDVLTQLSAINGNTGTANSLLESINGKDFKDQGLRDSLGKLKDVPKKSSSYARHTGQVSSGTRRAISALAKP